MSKEWGGKGRSIQEKMIVAEELAYNLSPCAGHLMGYGMAHETIEHGNDPLKQEILPEIANGSIVFWLALSEPNAGSDLLALQTRAEERGDLFIINGQKIWISMANLADYGYLFARTDPNVPRHKGLSMFIIDKTLPGVRVEPIINMAGDH